MSHALQCVILSAVSTVDVDFATSASRYPTMGLSLIRRSFLPRDIMDLVGAIISAGCIFQFFFPVFKFSSKCHSPPCVGEHIILIRQHCSCVYYPGLTSAMYERYWTQMENISLHQLNIQQIDINWGVIETRVRSLQCGLWLIGMLV